MTHAIDFVAKEVNSHRVAQCARVNIDDPPAYRVFASLTHGVGAVETIVGEKTLHLIDRNRLPRRKPQAAPGKNATGGNRGESH